MGGGGSLTLPPASREQATRTHVAAAPTAAAADPHSSHVPATNSLFHLQPHHYHAHAAPRGSPLQAPSPAATPPSVKGPPGATPRLRLRGALLPRSSSTSTGGPPGPRARLVLFMSGWFLASLASLFCAKHILHTYPVNEAVFTLSQFGSSVCIGLAFTKLLRLHPLASLSAAQLWAVLPLAAAFLVKEMLKYMAIARVSVNLVNTVRSLGPLFSIAIERVFLHHTPPRVVIISIVPTIVGVALTSYDEMHANSSAGLSIAVFIIGLAAATVSTAINQSQNIYSKILFGQERIDPVSLQIYLSAMSLAIMGPYTVVHSLYEYAAASSGARPSHFTFAPPSWRVAGILFAAGFINFLSSQLAFNTLALISPVSYSVANTFKRVCIAVIAIAFFGEHLSPINGVGIAVSIAGVFAYEKAARDYKQSKLYRAAPKSPNTSDAALPDLHVPDTSESRRANGLEYSSISTDPSSVLDQHSHQLTRSPPERQSYPLHSHGQT